MSEDIMPTEEPKRCVMCERVSGIFGILLGAIVLFIGIDILTNGAISGLISGRAEVTGDES